MGRTRKFENGAERQRAYRQRLARQVDNRPSISPSRRMPSRPARLAQIQLAVQALHLEYEQWLNSIPEHLEDSRQAHVLSDTVEQLEGVLDLLSEIQAPLGFGRD